MSPKMWSPTKRMFYRCGGAAVPAPHGTRHTTCTTQELLTLPLIDTKRHRRSEEPAGSKRHVTPPTPYPPHARTHKQTSSVHLASLQPSACPDLSQFERARDFVHLTQRGALLEEPRLLCIHKDVVKVGLPGPAPRLGEVKHVRHHRLPRGMDRGRWQEWRGTLQVYMCSHWCNCSRCWLPRTQ